MDSIYNGLIEYMKNKKVINTHSHHMDDNSVQTMSLEKLLKASYVGWCGVSLDETFENRKNYLEKVRYNSYFIWLQKSLQELYGMDEVISADNWNEYSQRINEAYKNNGYHIDVLKNTCNYENIVLDTYWNPGSNNGYPELFTPTYRINMFLFGYNLEARDHNQTNPLIIYNKKIKDIDEYIYFMKEKILEKKQEGCVALKCAAAYDRGLDFVETSKEQAQKAMTDGSKKLTQQDIKAFQDYIFFEICKIAVEVKLTLQIHTGLGKLNKSNAMQLQEVIEKNPETRFALLHCSYPWLDDINGLVHNYTNVYPDICWLPLISTSACIRTVDELIEVGTADKIAWGCDTWTSDESYGALLAVRHVLAKVLSGKIEDGYMGVSDAEQMIDNILYNNAKKLYDLK